MKLVDSLWQDPNRMSGAVCFRDTRIPVTILFDYLQDGRLGGFLRGYPDVSLEQVQAVIAGSRDLIVQRFATGLSQ